MRKRAWKGCVSVFVLVQKLTLTGIRVNLAIPINKIESIGGIVGRIIIVEDDALTRGLVEDFVATYLEGRDHLAHEIEVFGDGLDAILALQDQDDIVLVITGLTVPSATGDQVVEEGHRQGVRRFVMMSGNHKALVQVRSGLSAQAVELVPKPFSFTDILNALDRLFGESSS